MSGKKIDLDDATVRIIRNVLAMPPKHHDEIKGGRPAKKKQRSTKGRAASAKRRTASRTARE
jgi:hypothetical protein